jgi:hypothetical protein
LLWLTTVAAQTPFVVPLAGVTLLLTKILAFFGQLTYDKIVADFTKLLSKLDAFAKAEEAKAEAYLEAHVNLQKLEAEARDAAAKARTTAANIGKLFG